MKGRGQSTTIAFNFANTPSAQSYWGQVLLELERVQAGSPSWILHLLYHDSWEPWYFGTDTPLSAGARSLDDLQTLRLRLLNRGVFHRAYTHPWNSIIRQRERQVYPRLALASLPVRGPQRLAFCSKVRIVVFPVSFFTFAFFFTLMFPASSLNVYSAGATQYHIK